MNAEVFLDTNVLIYATLAGDPRAALASGLLATGGVISVQVLNEFASVAHRKLKRPWPEVATALADVRVLCPDVRPIGVEPMTSRSLCASMKAVLYWGYSLFGMGRNAVKWAVGGRAFLRAGRP